MNSIFCVVVFCGLIYSAESCKPAPFITADPCVNVKCPNGKICSAITDYYCDQIFCRHLAICSATPVTTIDACREHNPCKPGSHCVTVPDQCPNNGTLCTFKPQCNVRNRPGKCPDSGSAARTSCDRTCSPKSTNDATCPTGRKCCFLASDHENFCLSVRR
ncbi:hypothetical protein RvY_10918 [Ramazzottius varieornatus]|uniref:WAP domain-containing protein n=1 Tax=Ramazzottius varieornatus TaxID=947166 RepID=A0A1D1VEB5_RAMVA|nr:hypothetical protein RvY_10918 [Ramazzottius varieornatus]